MIIFYMTNTNTKIGKIKGFLFFLLSDSLNILAFLTFNKLALIPIFLLIIFDYLSIVFISKSIETQNKFFWIFSWIFSPFSRLIYLPAWIILNDYFFKNNFIFLIISLSVFLLLTIFFIFGNIEFLTKIYYSKKTNSLIFILPFIIFFSVFYKFRYLFFLEKNFSDLIFLILLFIALILSLILFIGLLLDIRIQIHMFSRNKQVLNHETYAENSRKNIELLKKL